MKWIKKMIRRYEIKKHIERLDAAEMWGFTCNIEKTRQELIAELESL